jgi:hypothetical protein
MMEEEEQPGYKPFGDSFFVKLLAILFVLGIYGVIFLKILFLQ